MTGKPLPPAARIRTDKVSNAVPMADQQRAEHYADAREAQMTPAHRRRRMHKLGRQLGRAKPGSAQQAELSQLYIALRESVR